MIDIVLKERTSFGRFFSRTEYTIFNLLKYSLFSSVLDFFISDKSRDILGNHLFMHETTQKNYTIRYLKPPESKRKSITYYLNNKQ